MERQEHQERLDDELNEWGELGEIEAALRQLRPQPGRLDRDRLMFLAGQRSIRPARRSRLWPAATIASTLAAVVLAALLAMRPAPQVVREVVFIDAAKPSGSLKEPPASDPAEPGTAATVSQQSKAAGQPAPVQQAERPPLPRGQDFRQDTAPYLHMRETILTAGLDAVPLPPRGGGRSAGPVPSSSRKALRELLGLPEPLRAHAGPGIRWPSFINPGEQL